MNANLQFEDDLSAREQSDVDSWVERLRLYSQKKREVTDRFEFDEDVHQDLIKEFEV